MLEVSGSKNHTAAGFLEPDSLNVGYLDPLGLFHGISFRNLSLRRYEDPYSL